ncbi:MAG: hypothetical protein K9L59_05705 [Desulfobacterales bacterium]|nr:hypothetical protein [Desulfobacterales bacterium]
MSDVGCQQGKTRSQISRLESSLFELPSSLSATPDKSPHRSPSASPGRQKSKNKMTDDSPAAGEAFMVQDLKEMTKSQAPKTKWFDKLTILSNLEGQYPNSKHQTPNKIPL